MWQAFKRTEKKSVLLWTRQNSNRVQDYRNTNNNFKLEQTPIENNDKFLLLEVISNVTT
jgi:hypothetical protein